MICTDVNFGINLEARDLLRLLPGELLNGWSLGWQQYIQVVWKDRCYRLVVPNGLVRFNFK